MIPFIPSLCLKKCVCNIIFSTTISATDLINDNFTLGLHLVSTIVFEKENSLPKVDVITITTSEKTMLP